MSTATTASEIALPPHPRDELKSLALEADQFYASDDWKNADAPTRQKYLDRSAEVFDEAFKSAESSLDEAEADSFYNSTTAFLQGKMAEHNKRVTGADAVGVLGQSFGVAQGMAQQTIGSGVMRAGGTKESPAVEVQPLDWSDEVKRRDEAMKQIPELRKSRDEPAEIESLYSKMGRPTKVLADRTRSLVEEKRKLYLEKKAAFEKATGLSPSRTDDLLAEHDMLDGLKAGQAFKGPYSGEVYVSPDLALMQDEYDKAVDATDATPEKKAKAKAHRLKVRDQLAGKIEFSLAAVDPEWEKWSTGMAGEMKDASIGEKVERFIKWRKASGAKMSAIDRAVDQNAASFVKQFFGLIGGITNIGMMKEAAATAGEIERANETIRSVMGGAGATGFAVDLFGGLAPTIAFSPLARLATTNLGAMRLMAGIGVAQGYGGKYADASAAYSEQGLSDQEAHMKAQLPALVSALTTYALARMMPRGVESIGQINSAKAAAKTAYRKFGGKLLADVKDEWIEESAQATIDEVVAKFTYDPKKDMRSALENIFMSGLMGGIGGGVVGAVSRYANKVKPILETAEQMRKDGYPLAAAETEKTAEIEATKQYWADVAKAQKRAVERAQSDAGLVSAEGAKDAKSDLYDAFGNVQRKAGGFLGLPDAGNLEGTPKVAGDANYKPEPAKESEPKNEKAQSVPSVQKADESVRLPQAEVAPAAPSPEPATPAAASHAQTAKEWESANKRKLPQNRAPIPESLSLPVGTVVRAKNYGENEGDIVITGPLRVNTSGIIEYPADFTGSGRMASVEANEITEIKPAAAKPVEQPAPSTPSWITSSAQSVADSTSPLVRGQIADLSAQRLTAKEIAGRLGITEDTVRLVRVADGIPPWTNSTNQAGGQIESPEFTAWLAARKSKDAQPAAAPAAEQPAPAPIEQAIADANWRGTVREVPAPRSMGGEGVKLYIPVDASGKDVSVGGQTILGKTPAEAIELAQKNAKPASAPVAAPTKGRAVSDMTPEQRQEQAQVIRDMMATNRENKKPIPQGWVNRLAELEGAPKPQEGEIYSNIVEGHPQHEASHAELRNLIPIKITSSEQLTRPGGKFDQAQALLDKWNKQIGTLEYQSKSAKTPALRKKAAAELSKLGAERAARDTLRDVIIPELNRLNSEALKREPVTPSSPAPVAGAKTRLDLMLDGVERTGKELTIEVTDANRDNLTKIIETAEKRGLRASTDGRFVLIRPAAAPAATPQSEGGIFGYAWADIRSKQQGGKLAALIRGNAPKATESDFAVLEKHGMDWLYENKKHSIIDRLGLPVDKPSKKAEVKPAAIPKIIDVTETPGAQVSGPRLAIKLDDGTIIHSADAGIHAVLAARAGIDPSRIVDTGFYGVLSGEFKGGKTTTAPTKSTLAPSPVSEAAKLRAKIVKGATVEVALVRGSKLTHRAKVQDVDTQNGVVTVTFKKGKKFNGGETQTVRLDQVAPLASVQTRMLNEVQFEGMTEDQKRQTKADAKEFDNLVADHPEMNWYNWRVNDLAGTKSGDMDIAAERKRASEEAMKEIGGDRPDLNPDNSIMKAELLPKLKAMIEEKAHELAREIPEDSLPSDTDFLPPDETPEPVAPKLRPSDGKGTGELLQGDAAPFNLVAETAADIAKREAREAAEQIAKDAKDAAEAKAKQDKEQGNLFDDDPFTIADSAPATSLPVESVQRAVRVVAGRLAGAMPHEVIADGSQYPQRVKDAFRKKYGASGDLNRIRGVVVGGRIYINAAAIENAREAIETFMHEAAGHGGVDALLKAFGEKATTQLDAMLKRLFPDDYAAVQRSYEPHEQVSETLARIMQSVGPEMSAQTRTRWQRVMDWLRNALNNLGVKRWSTNDVMALLRRGVDAVRKSSAATPDAGAVRMSYAGEKAQVPQFMRDSLDTAKAMAAAGKTSEEIRAVTGWFPGKYDGKMRWEVPDDAAAWKMELPTAGDARVGSKDTGEGSVWAVSGNAAKWSTHGNGVKLGTLLDHPELFKAYPESADIIVDVRVDPRNSGNASFDGDKIRIHGDTSRGAMSSLLHEVQHWIQEKEKFASGSSPAAFSKDNVNMMVASERLAEDYRDTLAFSDRMGGFTNEKVTNLPENEQTIALRAWKSADESWMSSEQIKSEIARLEKRAASLAADFDGSQSYRRAAGEIESRDVQARQNFTPEQRKAVEPYSSENIAKEDAIVMSGGGPVQMSTAHERITPEQDREYLAAVKRGDTEAAQRMVDEAAIAAGAHTNADGSVQHFIRGGNERGKTVFPGASFWTLDTEAGRKVAEGYRDSAGDFLGRKIPDTERKAKNADIFRMYRELPEPLKKGHALAAAMHAHGRSSDVSRYYNESAEQTFERVRQLVIKMAKEERWPHPEITQALTDKDWDKVLRLSEPHVYLAFEANPIGMTNGEVRDQLTSREQKHRYDALTSRANYFAPFKSITRAYLMFKNPLRLNGTGAITPKSVEQARKDGYDAIWSEGAVGGDTLGRDNRIPEVVVLSAEQVKSADPSTIPLSERFNPESDSIHRTANPADSLRETSTKNAVVDEERAKLGLDPIMSEIRQSHPVVWDAAMRALERDPMAGQSLVNEINGRPRALTATEEAIILRHKINTQTAFYREMEVANDGNASPQDRMSAKLYAAQHLDAMNEIDNATRKSGTEWGRLGAFRQRLAREDYTLVSMLRKRSMATGERIEPGGAEYQFVEKLNKRIAELEAKATQDARNHAAELEQLRETAMEDAIQKMRSDGTPAQKKEREILARIAANMEFAKENADAALREMGFGPVANAAGPSGDIIGTANPQDANTLDPKVLKLLSVGGANHLRKLGNDRAKWDEAMLSNYGPKVQPHLDAVWDVSQATLNDFIDGQAPKETRENTKKKILTDAEKQKRILDSIRRKSATPDKVAPYLKQLAKQLVSQGVSDRWTLLTTMETMLKDILPDATRSEIRDSLADYGEGKYRELSTDEASVKMRRLRAQLQQEAKIEDMMRRGELPWLIGSERGEPDAETRTMIKEVNEIKKELGLEATNENQGKSARAAIKTRLRNEIEELEKFIKTRERIPSNRRSVEDDPETAQLRRDVRELRAKYQEIVGVDTMAEEAAKESALEKSIADLQNQIVTGEIEQAAKQQTVDTPEIAALKAQKAALLEQRKALRSPSTEDIERKKEQDLLDRITKLSLKIATGVADAKVGKSTVESANVSAYRDIIKDLNKQLAEIRNPKKSPDQTKLDELDKRIAEVSAKIARGDLSAKQGKPTVDTAEQAVRKDTLRALNKQLADMRKAAKPTLTPDEIALKTWKTRAEKRLIDLKDRTARGDFSKKVRKVMPMDTEALKTKAALEAAKLEFDQANHKAMTANAPWWVKTMDVAQKYRRWAVLTSATVFEKLGMAAVWRTLVLQPIEDAVGSIIRHISYIKPVAVMAPRHGQGFNTRIQLDGLINGFASGASEAATHLKKAGNLLTGSKALSWLFGEMDEAKRLTQTPIEALSGKRKVEPDTAWEIPGVLHAVVKDIPKMVEFHKSVAFRTKWYADRGVDVSDPLMQEKIQIESFQDAMRAISMQENAVLNKLNRFIRSLGEPDVKTGKVNKWGKVWQTAFKVAFPIVKIPTNIVAEAFEYVVGLPAGLLNVRKVRKAIKDGITNLPPEHADMIMRQLKKGLVGNAILLTGFLLASNIGGYFQHGRKRDPDEVPAGGIRIGSTDIHERALHAPALLILQAGATIARVMDSRMRKSDVDEQGMGAGLVAAALGLADEIPFVKEAFNLSALRNPYQKSHWFGAKARSIVEPTLMQWIAKLRDTDEEGNPIKRQADGFVDEMKMGIPGLRETLDVKQEEVPHARSHRR